MRYLFLIMVTVSGFIGQVFGSEKNGVPIFHVRVTRYSDSDLPKKNDNTIKCDDKDGIDWYIHVDALYNPLRYTGKKYIDFLKKDYGIKCDYNEPFVMIYDPSALKIDPLTLIPLRYFIVGDIIKKDGNDVFKCKDATLFSFLKNQEKQVHIKLSTDLVDYKDPKNLLGRFKESSGRWIYKSGGCEVNEGDEAALEQELLKAEILAEENGKIVHGPNSYSGPEIRSALFYSRLKKLFCGSIAMVILCVLYKKFYNTAG